MVANQNETTLAGVYNDYPAAKKAAEELIANGLQPSQVHVTSNENLAETRDEPVHEGGITGWFKNLFGSDTSDEDHRNYADAVSKGNVLVTVDADAAQVDRAVEIMNNHGAVDIDRQKNDVPARGSAGYDVDSPRRAAGESVREQYSDPNRDLKKDRGTREDQVVPIVEENLQVGKRTVQRGGVRIISKVTERPVSEQVNLREEHVDVQRRPVDRAATEADMRTGERVVEVVESAEEAVVSKQSRVVEEVVVGKKSTERTETVSDTLRRTDVNVERMGAKHAGSYNDARADFERDYKTRYAGQQGDYSTYAPAYQYGYDMATNERYRGKKWNDVEEEMSTDYLRNNPNSAWDRTKGAVRYGWEKVTGNR